MLDEPDPDLEPFLCGVLMDNADFLSYVELDDWHTDDYRVSTNCLSIGFDSIHAFQQVDENAPLLIKVDVMVDLDVRIAYNHGGPAESDSGSGSVSFYASIVNDENGEPKTISDLHVFDCWFDWEHGPIWYAL